MHYRMSPTCSLTLLFIGWVHVKGPIVQDETARVMPYPFLFSSTILASIFSPRSSRA